MPRLKLWSSSKSSQGSQQVPVDSAAPTKCEVQRAVDPLEVLISCVHGPESHPFLRPMCSTFSVMSDALEGMPPPFPVGPALSAATEFLACSQNPLTHLEFALASHVNQEKVRQFVGNIDGALTVLAQWPHAKVEHQVLEKTLESWKLKVEVFMEQCCEAWEQHLYMVFLDVKGDSSLFEQAVVQLRNLLRHSSLRATLEQFRAARHFGETALSSLAAGDHTEVLKKKHTEAMTNWLADWTLHSEAASKRKHQQSADPQSGQAFWEVYFSSQSKITWPDFIDALEDYYFPGKAPMDLQRQLHLLVKPTYGQQVWKHTWLSIATQFGSVRSLVEDLIASVVQRIEHCVYRPAPLEFKEQQFIELPSALKGTGNSESSNRAKPSDENALHRQVEKQQQQNLKKQQQQQQAAQHRKEEEAAKAPGSADCQTPVDALMQPILNQPSMTWDEFVALSYLRNRLCWTDSAEVPSLQSIVAEQSLRAAALSRVETTTALTNRALILRVVSGDVNMFGPVLRLPEEAKRPSKSHNDKAESCVPAVVITANGNHFSCVSKFGRASTRNILIPDYMMSETIASRSHFNIVYDQSTDKFSIMDSGSKWGTFMKVSKSTLRCGDWLRVGVTEFIVRYCGGGCSCCKRHSHHKLHALKVSSQCWNKWGSSRAIPEDQEEEEDNDSAGSGSGCRTDIQDEMARLMVNRGRRGWISTSTRLSYQSAFSVPEVEKSAPSGSAEPQRTSRLCEGDQSLCIPIPPLELEFVSGPRMGNKIVLCDRKFTLGRGDGNAIQLCDATSAANVSRVHCVFRYEGNRWTICDNGSTNGTWRRLSCILEPSQPLPLHGGESILAGTHEFLVEEVDAGQCWFPSVASKMVDQHCKA